MFVSGTDCYGSPSMETYRKLQDDGYKGTMQDMVMEYHLRHKEDLKKFDISLNFFGASAVGDAVDNHKEISDMIFNKLYDNVT